MGNCAQPRNFQGTQRKENSPKERDDIIKISFGENETGSSLYHSFFFQWAIGQTKTAGSRPRVAIWPCLARTANYQEPVKPGTAKFTNMIG